MKYVRTLIVASTMLGAASLVSAQAPKAPATTKTTATTTMKAAPQAPVAKVATKTTTKTTTVGTGPIAESKPGLTAQATIKADDARTIALKTVANGKITREKLTEQSGKVIYRFTIMAGKTAHIVVVDAKTGDIVPAKATVAAKKK